MTSDQVQIVLVTAACAAGVGAVGLVLAWLVAAPLDPLAARAARGHLDRRGAGRRRRRLAPDVHLQPRLRRRQPGGRGRRSSHPARRPQRGCGHRPLVRGAAQGRPAARRERLLRGRPARTQRAAETLGGAGPHQRATGAVPTSARPGWRARGASWSPGCPTTCGHPLAGMRAMTEALEDGMAADPQRYHRQIRSRGGPDGPDGRRPVRALADPRRRPPVQPRDRRSSATWSARRSPGPTRWPARERPARRRRRGRGGGVGGRHRPLPGRHEPDHERHPAHARRRHRRGPGPRGARRGRAERQRPVRRAVRGRDAPGLRPGLARRARRARPTPRWTWSPVAGPASGWRSSRASSRRIAASSGWRTCATGGPRAAASSSGCRPEGQHLGRRRVEEGQVPVVTPAAG